MKGETKMAKVNAREILNEVRSHIDEYNDEYLFANRRGVISDEEKYGGRSGGAEDVLKMLEDTFEKKGKITKESEVLDKIREYIQENDAKVKKHELHSSTLVSEFYGGKRDAAKEILERLDGLLEKGEIVANVKAKINLKPKAKLGKEVSNDITDGM